MKLVTIEWKNNGIRIIDQTKLPAKLVFLQIKSLKQLWQAIKLLKVRGAPALGAAGALGVYLGVKDSRPRNAEEFKILFEKVCRYIGSSRPTARNLFWGIERMRKVFLDNKAKEARKIKQALFAETKLIVSLDMASCRSIGLHGSRLIKNNDTILTVCNTGILATIDYGTAAGVIYRSHEDGKRIKVYACETRPLLQGARLTTWELKRKGIDVTLICDNMAATLMKQGKISKVIAGADRIAANGDAANKIGTYNLAVLSRYHNIPFYIAAPASTFDLSIPCGRHIPIEQRAGSEVTDLFFKHPVAAKGVKVFNPAFDVTDSGLITAIITDKGVIRPPYKKNIRRKIGR